MARVNPNPRLEKLKDFRRHSKIAFHIICLGPGTRAWANNRRERCLRQEWRQAVKFEEIPDDVDRSRFTHRHSALWDLY